MKIILIGAGNVATHMGKALLNNGHDILQVYSRTMESASALATSVGATPVTDLSGISNDADVYIISVKDSVLTELLPKVCPGKESKVFLHTAGSMPMDVFRGMAHHYGVLYPMQTFSKSKDVDFSTIPCFIEACDEYAGKVIGKLADTLSRRVFPLSSEDRKYLHLSAVFACNFVNHCYAVSAEILSQHGIPFDVMLPLIDETAQKVHELSPLEAQTGPAVRYDENVIRQQAQLLRNNLLLKDLYERMSIDIHGMETRRKEQETQLLKKNQSSTKGQ